jgi:hypothetical protein
MKVEIAVSGQGISDDRIADSTAMLLKEIRVTVDRTAKLLTNQGREGDKGAADSFSQIALALVSGGAVSKLITAVFSFLAINRKLHLKLKKSNGETVELSLDYLDKNGSAKAMEIVAKFLAK